MSIKGKVGLKQTALFLVITMLVSILGLMSFAADTTDSYSNHTTIPSEKLEGLKSVESGSINDKNLVNGSSVVVNGDDGFKITVNYHVATSGAISVTWVATQPVRYFFIKGGNPKSETEEMGTLFGYDAPGALSETTPFSAPKENSLSHWVAYYGLTPTPVPTEPPTEPTPVPTETPTEPTPVPTEPPAEPTPVPTETPAEPTPVPTETPAEPTPVPTETPVEPTPVPTEIPTQPTPVPTGTPTQTQTITQQEIQVVLPPNEIPAGPPVDEKEKPKPTKEVGNKEPEIIMTESVPLAAPVLPKTGGIPVGLMSLIGGVFVSGGALLRKKKR